MPDAELPFAPHTQRDPSNLNYLNDSPSVEEGSVENRKSQLRKKQQVQYEETRKMKSMMNFESKLEKDLQETTDALVSQLKRHNILSNQSMTLMKPIEKMLHQCFDTMKHTHIDESKNFFAMSLKMFF